MSSRCSFSYERWYNLVDGKLHMKMVLRGTTLVLAEFVAACSGCRGVLMVALEVRKHELRYYKAVAPHACPWVCQEKSRTHITNYQLPNGPVKAGRRWGQRHPQGANLGSNGILNFLSKLKQWLPPAHPKSLASQCMSGQPISTCHALTS